MCGRFTLALAPEDIASLLRLNQELDAELGLTPRWNIAPGQEILAAARPAADADPAPARFRWGLVPHWAEDPAVGSRLINARGETVADKPSFRTAFRRRRCLVPADGFYEWQRRGKLKQPWLFRRRGVPGFCFAGLWEVWRPPEGDPLHTCTILTTAANEIMAPIHDRMPVILRSDDQEVWLDPGAGAERLQELIAPLAADEMEAVPVSAVVNSTRHDGPECAEAFALDDQDEPRQRELF